MLVTWATACEGEHQLIAGPDVRFDDPALCDAAAILAEDLLAHHDLAAWAPPPARRDQPTPDRQTDP